VNLADRVAQCATPFLVTDDATDRVFRLNNAADFARLVASCPIRYVLADDLTRLCADLAYSKGARAVTCSDLLRVPATSLWLEWCNDPWQRALERYGFPRACQGHQRTGRRGVLLQAARDGRRGVARTFWTLGAELGVMASSVEAYFDFDAEGEVCVPDDGQQRREPMRVHDEAHEGRDDVLARCFGFRYERSWANYYGSAGLSEAERARLWRHALGTIAMDMPMLLAFFLLLSTRGGLPQQARENLRLNRTRRKEGRPPLLEHVEVRAPLLPEYVPYRDCESRRTRHGPRLHHVRGHLVRRGSQLFWRVPHLRGSARAGSVQSRTVVWTFEDGPQRRGTCASPRIATDRLREQITHPAASSDALPTRQMSG